MSLPVGDAVIVTGKNEEDNTGSCYIMRTGLLPVWRKTVRFVLCLCSLACSRHIVTSAAAQNNYHCMPLWTPYQRSSGRTNRLVPTRIPPYGLGLLINLDPGIYLYIFNFISGGRSSPPEAVLPTLKRDSFSGLEMDYRHLRFAFSAYVSERGTSRGASREVASSRRKGYCSGDSWAGLPRIRMCVEEQNHQLYHHMNIRTCVCGDV